MTDQQKLQKAYNILETVRNTVNLKLEEVGKLIAPASPVEGKKKRRNLKEIRKMNYETLYKNR